MATIESQSEEEHNCHETEETIQKGLVEKIECVGLKPKEEACGLSLVRGTNEFESPKSSENDSEGTNQSSKFTTQNIT